MRRVSLALLFVSVLGFLACSDTSALTGPVSAGAELSGTLENPSNNGAEQADLGGTLENPSNN